MGVTLEFAAWWAATVGIWLVSLSAYSSQDLVVALACAVPCAALAVGARRAIRGAWRPPRDLWRVVPLLPIAIVADGARVLAAVWWRGRGASMKFRSTTFDTRGRVAESAGRRALWSLLLSSTPGTYVVDADPDGRVLLHSVGGPTSLERLMTR